MAFASKIGESTNYFNVKHPVFPWMVKHSQWTLNRFLIHSDGLTSFQRCFRQQSLPGLVEFGEALLFKASGKHDVAKADSSFTEGMWLGKDPDSGKHIIASSGGGVI